jgi:hypothetical protein
VNYHRAQTDFTQRREESLQGGKEELGYDQRFSRIAKLNLLTSDWQPM